MARRKPHIRSKVNLIVYETLEEQAAYQTGLATAIAGMADVISQFSEYALKNGKLPDICSDERKIGYRKGLAIALNVTAEFFQGFTDHIISEGEKLLKEKGWKGLNTEDDLK